MNRIEHLLTCLVEECAEVQKECTKGLRFGLIDNFYDLTPKEKLELEIVDLLAVIEMLEEEGIIKINRDKEVLQKKKAKIRKYMEYTNNSGTLSKGG